MSSEFMEAVFGLAEIMWLIVIAFCLLISAPVWLIPYTVLKVWKKFKEST